MASCRELRVDKGRDFLGGGWVMSCRDLVLYTQFLVSWSGLAKNSVSSWHLQNVIKRSGWVTGSTSPSCGFTGLYPGETTDRACATTEQIAHSSTYLNSQKGNSPYKKSPPMDQTAESGRLWGQIWLYQEGTCCRREPYWQPFTRTEMQECLLDAWTYCPMCNPRRVKRDSGSGKQPHSLSYVINDMPLTLYSYCCTSWLNVNWVKTEWIGMQNLHHKDIGQDLLCDYCISFLFFLYPYSK